MTQLGYAVLFISHDKEKTIKPQNGAEYQQICSSLQSSALSIIENMSDIITYAHLKAMPDGSTRQILSLRSNDGSVRCGSRFRHMPSEIEFSYASLTKALNDAIDKEAAETSNQYVTDERQEPTRVAEYDYDQLMAEFQDIVGMLMQGETAATAGPKITAVIDKYLGKGKKISDTTPDQAEFVYLIVSELKETFPNT